MSDGPRRPLPTQHTIFQAPPSRALPPFEAIVAALDDDTVEIAGAALVDLVEWVARTGAIDPVATAAVRRALTTHLAALPALLLAQLVALLLLRGGDDDSALICAVAADIVEIGDDEDQLELVRAFQVLGEGAPRTRAAMRDAVWPKLGGRALFMFLDDSDDDDDEHDGLWALIESRVEDDDRPALSARLARRAASKTPWQQLRDVVDDVVDGMQAFEARALARLGDADVRHLNAFVTALATTSTAPVLSAQQAEHLAADVGSLGADARIWSSFKLLTRHVHRLALPDRPLQRILAQLLGVAVRDDDRDGVALILAVVPAVVDNEILAFNLACWFARSGDRENLLCWTRRSLALRKPADQFRDDSDFDPWRDDDEFAALLAAG